jgi:hypothetical protein
MSLQVFKKLNTRPLFFPISSNLDINIVFAVYMENLRCYRPVLLFKLGFSKSVGNSS